MRLIRWLLADMTLPRWAVASLLMCWLAVIVNEVDARAAPLTVHAHQANLYGGKLATARVCVDLKVVKAERVELYVNGIGGGLPTVDGFPPIDGWEQWKGQVRHYRLEPGRRHFCRSFDVEHLVMDTVPDRPGLPRSRWNTYKPAVVQSVYAELTVGQRRPVGVVSADISEPARREPPGSWPPKELSPR